MTETPRVPLVPGDFQALDRPLVLDIKAGEKNVSIELSVESVSVHPAHCYRAEPFSIILAGPQAPLLPQGTYSVHHPVRGLVELFVVPIARDAKSSRYEVVFN